MASVNINDVLGAPQLCGTIQGTQSGIPSVLPPGMFRAGGTVEKDYGEYKRVTGARDVARLAAYGAPSTTAQLRDVEVVPIKLLHTVENIQLPIADYTSLTRDDSLTIDPDGVQEIARQVGEFRRRFDNLRVMAATSALFKGAIYYDGMGNLLSSSAGAKTTVDFAIPPGHQGQLNWDTNGNLLGTSWDNTAADIDVQVRTLRQVSFRETGYPIRYALYGKNVPTYLTNNTKLSPYFIHNARGNEQYLQSAEIPNPLLGLTWMPAYESFFKDSTGAFQSVVGDDQVVFMPEVSFEWWSWLEGKYPVPTQLGLVGDDAASMLSNGIEKKAGMFAYATLTTDPVALKLVAGDTFIPVLKVPKAVWIATVKF